MIFLCQCDGTFLAPTLRAEELFYIIKKSERGYQVNVKVNKEIRSFKEGIFFGLSVRQLVCAVGAVEVGTYLLLRKPLGM